MLINDKVIGQYRGKHWQKYIKNMASAYMLFLLYMLHSLMQFLLTLRYLLVKNHKINLGAPGLYQCRIQRGWHRGQLLPPSCFQFNFNFNISNKFCRFGARIAWLHLYQCLKVNSFQGQTPTGALFLDLLFCFFCVEHMKKYYYYYYYF